MALELSVCEIDNNSSIYKRLMSYLCRMNNFNNFGVDGYKNVTKCDDEKNIIITETLPFDIENRIIHNDVTIKIVRTKESEVVGTSYEARYREKITLSSVSKKEILKLIEDAINFDEEDEESRKKYVNIYVYEKNFWSFVTSRKKRDFDTIFLENDKKNLLVNDVESFISNRKKYETYGIPYKRTYLLLGPPGTGKTSVIFALASKLNMNIAIFKISNEKQSLENAYKSLPRDTILLIEDIQYSFPDVKEKKNGVSFDDLLNVLDGVFIKEKLITFLTSNSIDLIPKVMLRPGRVDEIVEFKYSTKKQVKEIFTAFSEDDDNNFESFYESIKHLKLTPALLMQYFFKDKDKRKISDLERSARMMDDKSNSLYT